MIAPWMIAGLFLTAGQPSAEQLYEQLYQGEFAPLRNCIHISDHWIFSEYTVVEEGTSCDIEQISSSKNTLTITTKNCLVDGEPIKPRIYILDAMSAEVVQVRVGERVELLERCTTR